MQAKELIPKRRDQAYENVAKIFDSPLLIPFKNLKLSSRQSVFFHQKEGATRDLMMKSTKIKADFSVAQNAPSK